MMSRITALQDRLEFNLGQITQANGYHTDAGRHVYKEFEYETAPPEKPSLIYSFGEVADTLEGETPPCQGEENHFLPVKVTGVIADNERGDQAELLRQDVLKAIKADPYFNGLAEGFQGQIMSSAKVVRGSDLEEEEPIEGFLGFCEVNITIFFVTAYGGES